MHMKPNPLAGMTVEKLSEMSPCGESLAYARQHKSLYAAWQNCERPDWMIWFLRRKKLLEKPIAVKFACLCAERVLPIFEKKHPDDKRPRAAIDAALKWLAE